MPKSVKIAVIGCGYWGKNLVRNFAELGALGAIFDLDVQEAQTQAEKYSVEFLTLLEILNSSEISGVVIATPAAQHAGLIKKALLAGKHVFVEKPLALDVNEAKELCKLSDEKKLYLMVGHVLQYHPAFLMLKQLIDQGKLGKLQYIYSNRLNLGKFRNEENILWSFAPHDISMILSLAGSSPDSIYATGVSHLHPHIKDITTTHITFQNGIHSHIFVSWLNPYKEQKLVVVGDRGMAVFNDGLSWDEKLQLFPHQVNWISGMPTPSKADVTYITLDPSEPLKLECQHFLDCITAKRRPKTEGQEGLRVLQVLDAAERSMLTGVKITLSEKILSYYKHETAIIDAGAEIEAGTKIWHFSHILNGTKIGRNCVIGQNVMIGPNVILGDNCKIQNNVSLYKGVVLENNVFCGPSCVFTNVFNPRANIERKDEFRETYVEEGVTIGANATIICGVRLGAYSFIGAGAVVTKDVKPHALMVGNPARQVGWVSHAAEKLGLDFICPRLGTCYQLTKDNVLKTITNETIEIEMA